MPAKTVSHLLEGCKIVKIYDFVGNNCLSKSQGQYIAEQVDLTDSLYDYENGICFDLENVIVLKQAFFEGLFDEVEDKSYVHNNIRFNNVSLTHMKLILNALEGTNSDVEGFSKEEVIELEHGIQKAENETMNDAINFLSDKLATVIHSMNKPKIMDNAKQTVAKKMNTLNMFDKFAEEISGKKPKKITEKEIFEILGISNVFEPTEDEKVQMTQYIERLQDPKFIAQMEDRTKLIKKNMEDLLEEIKR